MGFSPLSALSVISGTSSACSGDAADSDGDAAGEGAGLYFEALYVICLPAVHAEVEFLELGNDLLGIYAILCVALLGYRISLACRFFHILCS